MKLEVGMYVRTEFYAISKIVDIEDDRWLEIDKNKGYLIHRDSILKASHNIIDLIEVGDYVNGLRVYGITDFGLQVYMFGDVPEILEEKEIKSIVTKEQFESMSYRVGSEE